MSFVAVLLPLLIIAPGAAQVPPLAETTKLLSSFHETGQPSSIGPIDLRGFNFDRLVTVGKGVRVLLVSTLWNSSLVAFDHSGTAISFHEAADVERLWVVDLDQDGSLELVTDERVGRGTGFQLGHFRLYSVRPTITRLWEAESYRLEAPVQIEVDRRSYLRIVRTPTVHLEYRYPVGRQQRVEQIHLDEGRARISLLLPAHDHDRRVVHLHAVRTRP